MQASSSRVLGRAVVVILVAIVAWLGSRLGPPSAPPRLPQEAAFEEALAERRSGVVVTAQGRVRKLLQDDTRGSRHQRILLDVGERRTLLVVHNIDLAPRVPARVGDPLRVRGEFEWNEKGGLVHWTHHDPQGRRPGGWVEHEGRRYR